jgi:hypothetical protein
LVPQVVFHYRSTNRHPIRAKGDGAEQAMIELVGSELVKRAAEHAKRREERLKAQREGRELEEGNPEEEK